MIQIKDKFILEAESTSLWAQYNGKTIEVLQYTIQGDMNRVLVCLVEGSHPMVAEVDWLKSIQTIISPTGAMPTNLE